MAEATLDINGHCDEAFAGLLDVLSAQLASGAHHGFALAVHHRGTLVVDLWGGVRGWDGDERPWTRDTMAISFSTTKGIAALALHMALERAGVRYDDPVVSVWPGFGKPSVTVRHVLCHEAGVPQIRGEVGVEDMAHWDRMVALMERLEPLWEPGTANGYHAINFGWLAGELVRLLDGRDIGTFVREEIAEPLELDGCFIGTPSSQRDRLAPVRWASGAREMFSGLLPPESLTARALSPDGDVVDWINTAQAQGAVLPAFGGAFTARSLSRVYAALERGGALAGARLVTEATLAEATKVQNKRPDLVLIVPVYWRLGFMGGGSELSPAGPNREAFGHAGLGGSVAFADPKAEISFALVLDRLEPDLLGDERLRTALRTVLAAVA